MNEYKQALEDIFNKLLFNCEDDESKIMAKHYKNIQKLVAKETPKEPVKEYAVIGNNYKLHCPICNTHIALTNQKRCYECGQKIINNKEKNKKELIKKVDKLEDPCKSCNNYGDEDFCLYCLKLDEYINEKKRTNK